MNYRIIAFLASISLPALAQQQPQQSTSHLFPPHFIVQQAEAIGLSEEQHKKIREIVESIQTEAAPVQKKVETANREMNELLASDSPEVEEALEKLDELLDAERMMKRAQLEILIKAQGLLTAEQVGQLRQLKTQLIAQQQKNRQELEQRLQQKIRKVQAGMESLSQPGEIPEKVRQLMEKFGALMKQGMHDEAEATLDRAIQILGGETPADPKPQASFSIPKVKIPDPFAAATPVELQEKIEELRVKDVAWRKIEWKTCLLEGLAASQKENKPIVLWMFIDRPIDDKRC
ncbi:MAG: hypothetical protein HKN23_03045 [Verrucomicrobiales bacterium]|nr:hypothetical protein [Verrucomicrobiales bacterium]